MEGVEPVWLALHFGNPGARRAIPCRDWGVWGRECRTVAVCLRIGFTNRREVGGVWGWLKAGSRATLRITKKYGSANSPPLDAPPKSPARKGPPSGWRERGPPCPLRWIWIGRVSFPWAAKRPESELHVCPTKNTIRPSHVLKGHSWIAQGLCAALPWVARQSSISALKGLA